VKGMFASSSRVSSGRVTSARTRSILTKFGGALPLRAWHGHQWAVDAGVGLLVRILSVEMLSQLFDKDFEQRPQRPLNRDRPARGVGLCPPHPDLVVLEINVARVQAHDLTPA
jgi:hypothetical protein